MSNKKSIDAPGRSLSLSQSTAIRAAQSSAGGRERERVRETPVRAPAESRGTATHTPPLRVTL